jgi:hypothetical protein
MQVMLEPFVRELGDVREELGREPECRERTEERTATLEAELEALSEARESPESLDPTRGDPIRHPRRDSGAHTEPGDATIASTRGALPMVVKNVREVKERGPVQIPKDVLEELESVHRYTRAEVLGIPTLRYVTYPDISDRFSKHFGE